MKEHHTVLALVSMNMRERARHKQGEMVEERGRIRFQTVMHTA